MDAPPPSAGPPIRRGARSRGTNLGLLALTATTTATGLAAFTSGTAGPATLAVTAHGVSGLALLVLARPKVPIARRGWRRGATPRRTLGVVLSLAAVITVVSGVALTTGWRAPGPLTGMQIHVGAAVITGVLTLVHLGVHPVRPRRTDLSRRGALRAGGVIGVGGLLLVVLEAGATAMSQRRAQRRFTGSHDRGSHDPGAMPVTQWLFDPVPDVEIDRWRLRLVDADGDRELSSADLDDHPAARHLVATLDCTGGWYAEQRWDGVPLAALLRPGPAHRSVVVTSVTGFRRRFPLAALPDLLVATGYGGQPLRRGHGAPARLVAPGRRGVWWVKWLRSVELSTRPDWATTPLPLR